MLPLAAIGAIPAVSQGIQGINQINQGKKTLEGLVRPKYEIPSEIKSALTLSRQAYADPRLTGQGQAQNQIDATMANTVQQARDFGNPMQALSTIQANANAATNNLNVEAARQQERDLAGLQDMLGTMGKYQDQAWQMNKFSPYSDKYQEARQQVGAGQQNVYGALDKISSVGLSMLSGAGGKPAVNIPSMAQDAANNAQQTMQMSNWANNFGQGSMQDVTKPKGGFQPYSPNFFNQINSLPW